MYSININLSENVALRLINIVETLLTPQVELPTNKYRNKQSKTDSYYDMTYNKTEEDEIVRPESTEKNIETEKDDIIRPESIEENIETEDDDIVRPKSTGNELSGMKVYIKDTFVFFCIGHNKVYIIGRVVEINHGSRGFQKTILMCTNVKNYSQDIKRFIKKEINKLKLEINRDY